MAIITRKDGRTEYVGESYGEFKKRKTIERIAKRGYSKSEQEALKSQGLTSEQIKQEQESAKKFTSLNVETQQEILSKGFDRYNQEQLRAQQNAGVTSQAQTKQFNFLEASKQSRLEQEQKAQAQKQVDILTKGGFLIAGLNEQAQQRRQEQYKAQQEEIKGIDFSKGYYKRVEALSEREAKISKAQEKVFETLRIKENKEGNYFIEQAKGVARFPLSLPGGAFVIGGRGAFAVDSIFQKEGRKELGEAFGRVPYAIKEMYNPKNADFSANVIATGLMFKGATASRGGLIREKFGKTDLKQVSVKGYGEFTTKTTGKLKGLPYQETTTFKNVQNPSEAFSYIKLGKQTILIDKNAQFTTTTILGKKGNIIKQTKTPTTETITGLKPQGKPFIQTKELLQQETAFQTNLKYIQKQTQKYKVNEVETKTNIFTQTTSKTTGTAKTTTASVSEVYGKNPVTLITRSKLELSQGQARPVEVSRIFQTKGIEFVFDKKTPTYKDIYIQRTTSEGLIESGRITAPKYTQLTAKETKFDVNVRYTETPSLRFITGKKAQLNIFEKPTTTTPEKVQVFVEKPKLSTSQPPLSKPVYVEQPGFKPVPLTISGQETNVFNKIDYSIKPININEVKVSPKIETNIKQEISPRIETQIKPVTLPKVEVSPRVRVQQKVEQAVQVNIKQEVIQPIKQTRTPKFPLFKPQIPIKPVVPKVASLKLDKAGETGFNVFVKRKGVFEKANIGALSKEQAISYGAFRVGQEASATFKITPTTERVRSSKGFGGLSNFYSDFYKSRKESNTFIQKANKRISSFGEKRDITFKGLQAKKRKNIFG